jgi:hypothetical protein
MSSAIVLIILIAGIILAAYLTRLVNYYTFGYKMKGKDESEEQIFNFRQDIQDKAR